MENWNSRTKRKVYMVTLIIMIVCAALDLISGCIGLILGTRVFGQIYSAVEVLHGIPQGVAYLVFILTCVLVILFQGLLVFASIYRHHSQHMFFNIFPVIVYIIKVLMGFNVITGMSFTTMTSKFPIPGVGWVNISSEVGVYVLISFFVYLVMAFISFINIRLKDMI